MAYLKDNPEGYWFKRKLYGFGWTPAKPAGWIVVLIYLASIVGAVWYADTHVDLSEAAGGRLVVFIVAATVLLLVIAWRTGEPLKWQWGRKHDD